MPLPVRFPSGRRRRRRNARAHCANATQTGRLGQIRRPPRRGASYERRVLGGWSGGRRQRFGRGKAPCISHIDMRVVSSRPRATTRRTAWLAWSRAAALRPSRTVTSCPRCKRPWRRKRTHASARQPSSPTVRTMSSAGAGHSWPRNRESNSRRADRATTRGPRRPARLCYSLAETLSLSLGRLFEPYVVQILPLLLAAYGDGTVEVRDAVQETSKAIMSKLRCAIAVAARRETGLPLTMQPVALARDCVGVASRRCSAHCVKLILPSLLTGLQDSQWRTKQVRAPSCGSVVSRGADAVSSLTERARVRCTWPGPRLPGFGRAAGLHGVPGAQAALVVVAIDRAAAQRSPDGLAPQSCGGGQGGAAASTPEMRARHGAHAQLSKSARDAACRPPSWVVGHRLGPSSETQRSRPSHRRCSRRTPTPSTRPMLSTRCFRPVRAARLRMVALRAGRVLMPWRGPVGGRGGGGGRPRSHQRLYT